MITSARNLYRCCLHRDQIWN